MHTIPYLNTFSIVVLVLLFLITALGTVISGRWAHFLHGCALGLGFVMCGALVVSGGHLAWVGQWRALAENFLFLYVIASATWLVSQKLRTRYWN